MRTILPLKGYWLVLLSGGQCLAPLSVATAWRHSLWPLPGTTLCGYWLAPLSRATGWRHCPRLLAGATVQGYWLAPPCEYRPVHNALCSCGSRGCKTKTDTTTSQHRAHGVVVSHPLRMRKALGSIPSVSKPFLPLMQPSWGTAIHFTLVHYWEIAAGTQLRMRACIVQCHTAMQ